MQNLYVSAERFDSPPVPRPGKLLTDAEGLLKCTTCAQLYELRIPGPVRADDVEQHIQTLQSWIDRECAKRHPTSYFCTSGIAPCLEDQHIPNDHPV